MDSNSKPLELDFRASRYNAPLGSPGKKYNCKFHNRKVIGTVQDSAQRNVGQHTELISSSKRILRRHRFFCALELSKIKSDNVEQIKIKSTRRFEPNF